MYWGHRFAVRPAFRFGATSLSGDKLKRLCQSNDFLFRERRVAEAITHATNRLNQIRIAVHLPPKRTNMDVNRAFHHHGVFTQR